MPSIGNCVSCLCAGGASRIAGAEMFQHHQVFGVAPVGDRHAVGGGIGGDEQLVPGHLAVADQGGRFHFVLAERAVTLGQDRP